MRLNNREIARLKNLYFPLDINIEDWPKFLDYILKILNTGYPSTRKEQHQVIKSSPYIRKIIGDDEKEENESYYSLKKIKFYNAIYKSSVQTFRSIASHIRKTTLLNHKSCIQKLIKSSLTDEPICPYALAYAHWMKFILGYESISSIRRTYNYREYPEKIEFASKQDDHYLSHLFQRWGLDINDFTKESRTSVKWIFNRLMGHLIWTHFMNWLSISQEAAENRLEYRIVPVTNKNLPYYSFVIPKNKYEPIEFHWWNEPRQSEIKLECPFQLEKSEP